MDIEIDEEDRYELIKIILDVSHREWTKSVLDIKLKNVYNMNIFKDTNHIHDSKVNNLSECNLLHDILNPTKPLFYIYVWIHVQANGESRNFHSYWIVNLVPQF